MTISERIDIHGNQSKFDYGIRSLRDNKVGITPRNVELIINFCNDCLLGKTVLDKQKKRLSMGRVVKYLYSLKALAFWLQKDFQDVTQQEMESLIARLEADQLQYFTPQGKLVRRTYTSHSKHDYKATLRKFYKWLLGNNRTFPPIVAWIDTFLQRPEVPALSLAEVERLAEYGRTARDKCIIMLLFETGARAEEFLNIRLRNVERREDYAAVRLEVSKTFARTVLVYKSVRFLEDWLQQHPSRDDPNAVLFPLTYQALCNMLREAAKRARLGKEVRPHVLRHSCATWLASKRVGRYQMCKWMGWAMSSDMPDRYIDRTGVEMEEAVRLIRDDELDALRRQNSEMQRELAHVKATQPAPEVTPEDRLVQRLMADPTQLRTFVQSVLKERKGERQ